MAASLLLGWALTGGSAWAQQTPAPQPALFPNLTAPSVTTDHFAREPVPVPVAGKFQIDSSPGAASLAQPAGFREAPMYGRPALEDDDDTDADFQIHTNLPSLNRLVQRSSEKELFERIRQETRRRTGADKVPFPDEIILTKEKHTPRVFPPALRQVEPSYVAHGRITFEQTNFERAGWDMGFLQPAVCMGIFAFDTLTLPYQVCKRPFEQMDTSAGKCLPGDLDPFVLYPPEWSLTGLLGQTAAMVGGLAIFPASLNPN